MTCKISLRYPASAWEKHFNELKEFKKQHGHCLVSTLSKTHATLGNWVRTQRQRRKRGILSEEQIRRLDRLGFIWNPRQYQWEQMLTALIEYKRVQGHCRVPLSNPTLGNWVQTQRAFYKRGKLGEERIRRLKALGFQWRGE